MRNEMTNTTETYSM